MGRRGSHGACGWGINPAARHPLRLLERLPGVARAWYGAHTGRGHAESTQTPPAGDTPGTSSLERAVTSPRASCEQPELLVGTGLGSLPFPQGPAEPSARGRCWKGAQEATTSASVSLQPRALRHNQGRGKQRKRELEMGRRRYLPQNTPLQKGIASLIRHQLGLSPFTSPLCLPGVLAAPQGFCPPAARSHAVFLPCPAPPRCVFLAPAPSHPIPHGQWYPAPSPAAPQQGCPSTRAPPITWKKKKKGPIPSCLGCSPLPHHPLQGAAAPRGWDIPAAPAASPCPPPLGAGQIPTLLAPGACWHLPLPRKRCAGARHCW